jgi:heme/copper-type cytochrome/quinol oxidase subunit 2
MNLRSHAGRIGALTLIGTAIVLPLVIFVLGPNMPPGKRTTGAASQVTDNTVLLVVMTPFTVFILVYLGYAIARFRAAPGEELRDGPPIRGHMPSQIAWLAVTSAAVLFLAIFGTAELFASNGTGGGNGPKPISKAGGSVLPVQVIGQQWEFTFRTGKKGHYRWQCYVPCAAGFLNGFGGPMQTIGYMDGFVNVV